MKKKTSLILFTLLAINIFAESYQIADYKFNIKGSNNFNFNRTKETALLMKYPLDVNTIFDDKESFESYISNYKQLLINTRAFEDVSITYDTVLDKKNDLVNVILYLNLNDSNHLLALPYPKFSSNSGFTLKLKAKDTNFLGTLNPLSADLYLNYKDNFEFGINFAYDYPFKAGIFNAEWTNDLNINYTIGNKSPAFSSAIGVNFSLPKNFFSVNFGASQTIGYLNKLYFNENLFLSFPIVLYKANNYTNINYSPSISFNFKWDTNFKTDPIENLELNFGHSISNSKINWNDHFRSGYSISLGNTFNYNIMKNSLVPSISLECEYFNNFPLLNKIFLDRFGINSRLYVFSVIDVPNRKGTGNQQIGNRLRGILDNRLPKYPCGVVFNFDFPISIITTNFPITLLNFNMQLSPFVDVALPYDKENLINIKDGYYCAGMEVLVNPLKFSSYTIRASIGFDIDSVLKANNKFEGLLKNNEIYIGLDLHY